VCRFKKKSASAQFIFLAIEVFSENSKSMNKKLTRYLFLNSVKYKILRMNMRIFERHFYLMFLVVARVFC
jgi:hypothetical protein